MEHSSLSSPTPPFSLCWWQWHFMWHFFKTLVSLEPRIKCGSVFVKICESLRAQAFSIIEEDSETVVWGQATISLPEKKAFCPSHSCCTIHTMVFSPEQGYPSTTEQGLAGAESDSISAVLLWIVEPASVARPVQPSVNSLLLKNGRYYFKGYFGGMKSTELGAQKLCKFSDK